MGSTPPNNKQKFVAAALLASFFLVFEFGPSLSARAVVPTFDVGLNELLWITQPLITIYTEDTAANTKSLVRKEVKQTVGWSDISWSGVINALTDYVGSAFSYDALATMAMKFLIRTLRDTVIRYIRTGRFEGPTFSTSFTIDTQQTVENAARIFLSELSGINFCAGFPPVPPEVFFALDIDLTLACTFPGDQQAFLNGDVNDFVSFWSSEKTANDFWNAQVTILDRKLKAERQALKSFAAEYAAGEGFLGIRDPATGKIKTPGAIVAEPLRQSIASDFRGLDVADEMSDAVAKVVDILVQTMLEKVISEGLAAL